MAIYSRSSVPNVNNWRLWIRKTNELLNLIKEQDDIDKHTFLIKKREDVGIKHFK